MNTFLASILHILIFIFTSFYAFIFPKNSFDFIYLFYSFTVILSWTVYNGECYITYWMKLIQDPNYVPGKNVMNNKDFYVLPFPKNMINMWIDLTMMIWWVSIYYVFQRNKYPKIIPFILISCWALYKIILGMYENHDTNKEFHYYQGILFYILFFDFLYFMYYKFYTIK